MIVVMDEKAVIAIAGHALAAGQTQEALESLIQAATRWPSCKESIRPLLIEALSGVLDEMLQIQGPSSPLFRRLVECVAGLYAGDPLIATVLGTRCLNEGALKEAGHYLQAALTFDPYCVLAQENMVALNEQLVHRWHFKMLNDLARNSAYFRAIRQAVRSIPDCSVLDIGSGTGILSMMAVRSGAQHVYACELNETFAAMSCDILLANGMEEKVSVINCPSTSLKVPGVIPERVSLVVTETVDAGLLGEWIVPSLRHAWTELLLPKQQRESINEKAAYGHVIPCGATVYITLIECPEVRKQSRLLSGRVGGVCVESVILEGSCCASSSNGRDHYKGHRQVGPTPLTLVHEPYTCERLNAIRGGYRQLSHTVPALEFDFTNPLLPLPPSSHLSLPIVADGTLDALVVWFRLQLDHTHQIHTAPSEDTSWDQAVFPVATPIPVREGVIVGVCASSSDTSLCMTVEGIKDEKICSSNEVVNDDKICFSNGAANDDKMSVFNTSEDSVFYVERSDLLRLNDLEYITAYQQAIASVVRSVLDDSEAGEVCEAGGSSEAGKVCEGGGSSESAKCVILDFSQGLSFVGLMAALEGADFVVVSQTPPMYYHLLEELVATNGLSEAVSVHHRMGVELVRTGVQWDVVMCDVVSPQGTLHPAVLEELQTISTSSPSSVFIPAQLSLQLALVSSPTLRASSSVLGTLPTLGFDIACHMNCYQVTHFTDLNLSSVSHTLLSDHTHICTLTPGKTPINTDKKLSVRVTEDGTVTGIAYWFTLHLYGDIILETGPACTAGHWHQSVFMLPEDVTVVREQVLEVHCVLRDSCLLLELEQYSAHDND